MMRSMSPLTASFAWCASPRLRRLLARQVQLICTLLWVAPMRRHVLVITYPTEPDETPVNVNALLAAAPLHAPALRRLHRQQPYADHRHPMTVRATLADVTDDVILMVDENTTFPHMAYFVKKQLHIDPSRIIVVIRINGINVVGVTPAMIHEHDHLEFIEVMSHEDVTLETLMELMNAHE